MIPNIVKVLGKLASFLKRIKIFLYDIYLCVPSPLPSIQRLHSIHVNRKVKTMTNIINIKVKCQTVTNIINIKVKSQGNDQYYKHKGKKSGQSPTS